jgi:hypothetical protein
MRIAYYFDYDYADGTTEDIHARKAVDLAIGWMNDGAPGDLQMTTADDGSIAIEDTRRGLVATRRASLSGWKAAVYRACDRSQLMQTLVDLPDVRSAGIPAERVQAFLDRCLRYQIMVSTDSRFLSVAVHVPERRDETAHHARTQLRLLATSA